jgi:hypothetical protein
MKVILHRDQRILKGRIFSHAYERKVDQKYPPYRNNEEGSALWMAVT